MTFDPENVTPPGAKIKVIGVGGGGGNAVNTMIRSGLDGVDFITANTDVQALRYSLAPKKLQIGKELTRGLGAGADPDIGRDAAIEDKTEIQSVLKDADMVFITAGMGGGTGTGGAAVVAQIARELGALTVAVVTKPFTFEGKRRRKQAEAGIARLRESVDTLITIPNQRLLQVASPELSMIDAFKMADDVLVNAVRGISDIINIHGMLNVDFADVKTVMSCMGQALMGIGNGRGEKRAVEAALMAISSPLLEEVDIEGATGILINITGGTRITMHEINEACGVIQEAAHEDANIIFGAVIDESLGDELRVTVIATGFPIEKSESDSDPIKGKPFPSVVANRLANAAGISEIANTKKVFDPPKITIPSHSESTVEIEELPQSPFDDLSFKSEKQSSVVSTPLQSTLIHEPVVPHDMRNSAEPNDDKNVTSQVGLKEKSFLTSESVKPSTIQLDSQDAHQESTSINTHTISHVNFQSLHADEAHELAKWTLDLSSDGLDSLSEDIPSLSPSKKLEEKIEMLTGQVVQTDDREDSKSSEVMIESSKNLSTEHFADTGFPSDCLDVAVQQTASSHTRDNTLSSEDILEEYTEAFSTNFPNPDLSNTLFTESLLEAQNSPHLSHQLESVKSTEVQVEARAQDSSIRKGASKETLDIHPLINAHEVLNLADIDRQIDEALELANHLRQHRLSDEDDLEVPAFLRNKGKEIIIE